MPIFKFLFTVLIISVALQAFSQNDNAVHMKWKLEPGEIITYKTIMRVLDTSSNISIISKFGNNSIPAAAQKLIKDIKQQNYVTSLKEKKKNVIDVEMSVVKDTDKTKEDTVKPANDFQKFKELMSNTNGGVMLRGIINEDGNIESFYTRNDQKNLIAMFFQLPGKPVKVGDSWPLDIHLIAMDQNFVCDSSYNKNEVIVVGITGKNDDKVVMLKYNIIEYVSGDFTSPFENKLIKTSMTISYNGIASFSTKKGRWISYDGIMSNTATGIMTANSREKFSLIANN